MKIKRRHLTLLEVMIALGLAMAILTALATFHWQMVAIGVKAEKGHAEMSRQLLLQHQISSPLRHIQSPKYFYFSESDPYVGLVFMHSRGNDLNKTYSNEVLSRIFVFDKHLYLATLPSPDKWTEEQPEILVESLAEGVTQFLITFIDEKGEPSNTWAQDRKSLPAIIVFEMNIAGKEYKQRVVIPQHKDVIEL